MRWPAKRAAKAVLSSLAKSGGPEDRFSFERTLVLAALGETDEAFTALASARQHHSGWLAYADVEPRLDPLRGDPRFAKVRLRPRG